LILRKPNKQIEGPLSEVQLMSLLQRRLTRLMGPTHQDPVDFPDPDSARTVQDAMVEIGRKLNRPGWLAYLVGGTLRDLLVEPDGDRGVQPRDIDIIVDGATREQVQEVLRKPFVLERFTRFGGLHLSRGLCSGRRVLFDIWTLADTWGFHSQNIAPRIQDFPGTTFLNIDSCATELIEPQRRQRPLFEKGFFEGIAKRVLHVNYAPNPYPYVCVARTLVLAAQLNFTIARPLAKFILDHTATGGIDALIEAQRSHYGTVRCDAKELEVWLHDIQRQFDSGQHPLRIQVPHGRHLELWSDHLIAADGRSHPRAGS